MFRSRAIVPLVVVLVAPCQAATVATVIVGIDAGGALRIGQLAAAGVVAAAIVAAFLACVFVRAIAPDEGRRVVAEAERYTRAAAVCAANGHR